MATQSRVGATIKRKTRRVVPLIRVLVAKRPTYGYRRITAILNRLLRKDGHKLANHKRVYRIMQANQLLLSRRYTERPDLPHGGKVIVMRSNLRWCSDGFEFTCWNGDVIRVAFIIDAHDREIMAWRGVVNGGISGSDIRDMMLETVEKRFGALRAPETIEILTDNGSAYTARETIIFARQLNLKSCFTPVKSPQSNGMSLRGPSVRKPSSKPSNGIMFTSTRCQMPKQISNSSRSGSRTTTKTIRIPG